MKIPDSLVKPISEMLSPTASVLGEAIAESAARSISNIQERKRFSDEVGDIIKRFPWSDHGEAFWKAAKEAQHSGVRKQLIEHLSALSYSFADNHATTLLLDGKSLVLEEVTEEVTLLKEEGLVEVENTKWRVFSRALAVSFLLSLIASYYGIQNSYFTEFTVVGWISNAVLPAVFGAVLVTALVRKFHWRLSLSSEGRRFVQVHVVPNWVNYITQNKV